MFAMTIVKRVSVFIDDFNLLITTLPGHERQLCSEMKYLLIDELGDPDPIIEKSGIRGLIVAEVSFDSVEIIERFRAIIHEYPYKFRYALRVIPIQRVVATDLAEVKRASIELAKSIPEENTFRITVEKRLTSLHSKEVIEAAASEIKRTTNLSKPDNILLIEVLGKLTGISLIKPDDVLIVTKEKML
jgi:tRNA acetyltransferase TAN1